MKRLQSSVTVLALLAFSTGGWAGCAAPPETNPGDGDPGPTDHLGTASSPITAADAISRAEEWVSAKLLYCQAANGKPDSDPDCSSVCKREKNADWDPYRSDCSGLVSWAWGLDAPGLTTAEMAPNQGGVTYLIQASSLQPGDAVNTDDSASSEHHVMLFKEWTVQGDTATFIEEPGCSATPDYAHEFTSKVTMSGTSITVAYNGIHFKAIRYNGLNEISSTSSGSPPPTCQVDGVDGDCIDESVCATMDGYKSTAGYCPGPATEKCCTPIDGVSTSAATTSSGSASGGAGGAGGQGGSPPLGSTASSSSAGGVGGAGGSGGAKTKTSTDGGCQLGEGEPTGNLWGLGLGAIGLAVAIRRRRRDR